MENHSKKRAAELGLVMYFNGHKCSRGHFSMRDTRTGYCLDCCMEALGLNHDVVTEGPAATIEAEIVEKPDTPIELLSRVISREDAILNGANVYFTGYPCKKGHFSPRLIRNYECVECRKELKKEWRKRRTKKWLRKNSPDISYKRKEVPDKKSIISELMKTAESKRDAILSNIGYVIDSKDTRDRKIFERAFNRAVNSYKNAKRRGAKTKYGMKRSEIISETVHLFLRAEELEKETGIKHHIDHIVPIMYGGTHSSENLQVISADEHVSKSMNEGIYNFLRNNSTNISTA